jgi:hypothetical protein
MAIFKMECYLSEADMEDFLEHMFQFKKKHPPATTKELVKVLVIAESPRLSLQAIQEMMARIGVPNGGEWTDDETPTIQ